MDHKKFEAERQAWLFDKSESHQVMEALTGQKLCTLCNRALIPLHGGVSQSNMCWECIHTHRTEYLKRIPEWHSISANVVQEYALEEVAIRAQLAFEKQNAK